MSDIILESKKLTRTFISDDINVTALNSIDTQIHKGDFIIIMGPSGSGKSTLLYNLSRLDNPTEGSVFFNGQDISLLKDKQLADFRRNNFGFVFQYLTLIQNLTIAENMLIPGFLIEKNRKKVMKRADFLFETLGIPELADRFPTQLSGGQQQRAAIARALINSPDILFADEPTGTLNFKAGQTLLSYLHKLNKTGQTILMVTHDLKSAAWGDRILYLQDGEINGEFKFPEDKSDPELDLIDRERLLFSWLSEKGW